MRIYRTDIFNEKLSIQPVTKKRLADMGVAFSKDPKKLLQAGDSVIVKDSAYPKGINGMFMLYVPDEDMRKYEYAKKFNLSGYYKYSDAERNEGAFIGHSPSGYIFALLNNFDCLLNCWTRPNGELKVIEIRRYDNMQKQPFDEYIVKRGGTVFDGTYETIWKCDDKLNEKLSIQPVTKTRLNGMRPYNYRPTTKAELIKIMDRRILKDGVHCNLNDINVSAIKDMSGLFMTDFNRFDGDISEWNVSNVVDMSRMFYDSDFKGDISKGNVGKVENMYQMFAYSKFNGKISNWDLSSVNDMFQMFANSYYSRDLSCWDISHVRDVGSMFIGCPLELKKEKQPNY